MNELEPKLKQSTWRDYDMRLLHGVLSMLFLFAMIVIGIALGSRHGSDKWFWVPVATGFVVYGVMWMRLMRFPCPSCQQPFFGEGAGFISPRSPFFKNACANCGLKKHGSPEAE